MSNRLVGEEDYNQTYYEVIEKIKCLIDKYNDEKNNYQIYEESVAFDIDKFNNFIMYDD
jgi:hypothetical protein